MNLIQTIVEVSGLEMMGLSRNLDTGHVVQVGIGVRENCARSFQAGRLAVVQNNDSKTINGIVLVTGAANRIHDKLVILTAAGNKAIDSGHVVSSQPHLGPVPLLQRPHGPDVVHERGNGDYKFDGNENPGCGKGGAGCLLRQDDAGNAKSKVGQVHSGVEDGEKGRQSVEISPPAFPDVGIVSVVQNGHAVVVVIVAANLFARRTAILWQKSGQAYVTWVLQFKENKK